MASCGTCSSEVPRNMRKKIDRTVFGVSLRRLLSEYFDFSPMNPVVCRQCDLTLEQIVKINVKLEKLTIQRNSIISEFSAKLSVSNSESVSESAEIPVARTDERQVKYLGGNVELYRCKLKSSLVVELLLIYYNKSIKTKFYKLFNSNTIVILIVILLIIIENFINAYINCITIWREQHTHAHTFK